MLTRRHFGGLALAAQTAARPNVAILVMRELPATLPGAVTFSRAYAVSGDRNFDALRYGRYPHAIDGDTPLLEARLRGAGYRDFPNEPFFALERESSGRASELVKAANTIVVMTTDSAGGDWAEANLHTPLSIRWTERLRPREEGWLMASIDIAPTVTALCGLPAVDTDHGTDRSGLLLGNGGNQPEAVYGQGRLGEPGEWRMLIRGWDKLIINAALEPTHLFNLARDPQEKENLAEDRATIRRREELLAVMRPWILKTADRIPYPLRRRN